MYIIVSPKPSRGSWQIMTTHTQYCGTIKQVVSKENGPIQHFCFVFQLQLFISGPQLVTAQLVCERSEPLTMKRSTKSLSVTLLVDSYVTLILFLGMPLTMKWMSGVKARKMPRLKIIFRPWPNRGFGIFKHDTWTPQYWNQYCIRGKRWLSG